MRGVDEKNPELFYELHEGQPEVDEMVTCAVCAAVVRTRHARHHEEWHHRLAKALRTR